MKGKRGLGAVVLIAGLVVAGCSTADLDNDTGGGGGSDGGGFSYSSCSEAWDEMASFERASFGSRSGFVDGCTSGGFKSLMCSIDPYLPEC